MCHPCVSYSGMGSREENTYFLPETRGSVVTPDKRERDDNVTPKTKNKETRNQTFNGNFVGNFKGEVLDLAVGI